MDESRKIDLARLQAIIDNPLNSQIKRNHAYKTRESIVEQMKDKKLVRLRSRLVNAAAAGDLKEERKIAEAIKAHMKEEYTG